MNSNLYFITIVNFVILFIFKYFENKNIRLILFSLLLIYLLYKYEIKNGFTISLLISVAEYIIELIFDEMMNDEDVDYFYFLFLHQIDMEMLV